MTTQASTISNMQENAPRSSRAEVLFQFLVLGLLLLFLVNYKGTVGINKIRQTLASGHLSVPAIQQGDNSLTAAFRDGATYLKIVWPALLFGVLISAAVSTSLSRTPLHALFGRGAVRDQVTGALAGTPLMLCSCCAAPIFPAIYQRTRRVAPALAVVLAAPVLNPVALTLSFILFPWRIAGARLAMGLVLVLAGSAFVAAITRSSRLGIDIAGEKESGPGLGLWSSYAKSLASITLRTVPLVVAGIFMSMWVMRRLPLNSLGSTAGAHAFGIAIVALVAVLVTLPSLFEIPLALSILALGGPVGAAAAMLFAGPAINLSSLFVIGRHSGWKVAVTLAGLVWGIAAAGGLLLR